MSKCPVSHHGMTKAKGCQHAAPASFTKLFKKPELPAFPVNKEEAVALGGPGSPMHNPDRSRDPAQDNKIPSGYTFFAQFIDHDITLEIKTGLDDNPRDLTDIQKLPNIRTASLDLDCVYGFGPEASPHLYIGASGGRLITGNVSNPDDLARNELGAALIGDPRNDENIFVSQMQLLWIRFHNKLLDCNVADYDTGERFEETQKQVRYYYQYLVLFDFLKRVCDKQVYEFAVKKLTSGRGKYPLIFELTEDRPIQMPVEFSVAAFRFGHSLVRSSYAVNGGNPDVDLFDPRFGTEGFSSLPLNLVVDWRFLLDVDTECIKPLMCRRIDELLADELIHLPVPITGNRNADELEQSLAARNLLRGNALSLPSGQAAAEALKNAGYPVNPAANLNLAAALIHEDPEKAKLLKRFEKETPLFFYLLREANVLNKGQTLGPVGSAILMEVFGAMLSPHCNSNSFLNDPDWEPEPFIKGPGNSNLTLADIVRFVES